MRAFIVAVYLIASLTYCCFVRAVFAENASVDARRAAAQEVNDTVWALTGFSAPLLIGGVFIAGGTTGGTITYSVFAPGVVVGASQYYPISPRSDRFLGKSPAYVSAYVDAYEREVKSLRRRSLLWGFSAGVGLLIVLTAMDIL